MRSRRATTETTTFSTSDSFVAGFFLAYAKNIMAHNVKSQILC